MIERHKKQSCLHCAIGDAIQAHLEAVGAERDPADGKLIIEAEEVCDALLEVLAEIVAGAPDIETRLGLVHEITIRLAKAVTKRLADGSFIKPISLQ